MHAVADHMCSRRAPLAAGAWSVVLLKGLWAMMETQGGACCMACDLGVAPATCGPGPGSPACLPQARLAARLEAALLHSLGVDWRGGAAIGRPHALSAYPPVHAASSVCVAHSNDHHHPASDALHPSTSHICNPRFMPLLRHPTPWSPAPAPACPPPGQAIFLQLWERAVHMERPP